MIVVVVGVGGLCMSTLVTWIAEALNMTIFHADTYYSHGCKTEMSAGQPLTDLDREH